MDFDIIVIGAGPAGLTAGIYGSRGGMKTAVIEKGAAGGQMVTSWEVENYPGAAPDSTGPSLSERMREQAEQFGTKFIQDEVFNFEREGDTIKVECQHGTYEARALIVATGASPRLLGVPGELELRGLGVSYCATCDANFFRNMDVAVVGGGDTALEEALYLTKFASHITLIHRRDTFRAAKILQKRVLESDKIDIIYNSVVDRIKSGADGLVDRIDVRNVADGSTQELKVQGIFIFAGHIPDTKFLEGKVKLTAQGYIPTDEAMKTNVEGVYAAGDVREKELRQIVTATSDGAIAAVSATHHIEDQL